MTIVENLLARKRQLLQRLEENPGEDERNQIEGLLSQIDTALDFLDDAGQGETGGDEKPE